MFKGLEKLDATTSAFLLNGIPILTFLLGAAFLKERPTSLQWLGAYRCPCRRVGFFSE